MLLAFFCDFTDDLIKGLGWVYETLGFERALRVDFRLDLKLLPKQVVCSYLDTDSAHNLRFYLLYFMFEQTHVGPPFDLLHLAFLFSE